MCLRNKLFVSAVILVMLASVTFALSLKRKKCKKESYRDPIYIDKRNMKDEWLPKTNGSIYGENSHLFSGFPYYDKAY